MKSLERRIKQLEAKAARQEQKSAAIKRRFANEERIKAATSDPYTWVTEYTETFDEHWVEEKRPSPYEHFPRKKCIYCIFDVLDLRRILFIEKSRDMMVSWICVAYLTLAAMKVPERGVLFQTQTKEKAIQPVKYAKCLYETAGLAEGSLPIIQTSSSTTRIVA